jgi:hypothetical protein
LISSVGKSPTLEIGSVASIRMLANAMPLASHRVENFALAIRVAGREHKSEFRVGPADEVPRKVHLAVKEPRDNLLDQAVDKLLAETVKSPGSTESK